MDNLRNEIFNKSMKPPNITTSFDYKSNKIHVEWYEISDVNQLPNVNWQQVYALCNLDSKVPLVYDRIGKLSLPGGRVDIGETIEQTLKRELKEEMNCKVVDWELLGYQKLSGGLDGEVYQIRAYAKIQKISKFLGDPDGTIIGHKLFELSEINKIIKYGDVGDRMIELVTEKFS